MTTHGIFISRDEYNQNNDSVFGWKYVKNIIDNDVSRLISVDLTNTATTESCLIAPSIPCPVTFVYNDIAYEYKNDFVLFDTSQRVYLFLESNRDDDILP
jgi:hypothetical protein